MPSTYSPAPRELSRRLRLAMPCMRRWCWRCSAGAGVWCGLEAENAVEHCWRHDSSGESDRLDLEELRRAPLQFIQCDDIRCPCGLRTGQMKGVAGADVQ